MATIRVHVVPNAKIDNLVGDYGGAFKIKLRAPAVEGKANAALIDLLAARLHKARRQITIVRGQKSRDKVVQIDGLSDDEVRQLLLGI